MNKHSELEILKLCERLAVLLGDKISNIKNNKDNKNRSKNKNIELEL